MLSNHGANIQLRLPLIEGINTNDEHIQDIMNFIANLRIDSISLLPYHHMGQSKYKKMNIKKTLATLSRPSDLRLEEIQSMFQQEQYEVKIGG